MKNRIIFFFTLILKSFSSYSQFGWEAWEEIYKDNYVTVEIQYKLSNNSCDIDGRRFKFRYRIIGEYRSFPYFVNWKMDYTDCNGTHYYQQNSVPIWRDVGGVSDEMIIESIDDIFSAKSLDNKHYDIKASTTKQVGSGKLVMDISNDPYSIGGRNLITAGESTELYVVGGHLGEGAQWIWYKDNCGFNKIGSGNKLTIHPSKTSDFFVRAEGKFNVTKCAQITINVDQKSKAPIGIILKFPACTGVTNTLIVNGGQLVSNAAWKWYENSCGGKFIGTGNSVNIIPNKKTTYFVRAEGKDYITECAKLEVNPYNKSLDPTSSIFSKTTKICEGEEIELRINDVNLSSDAQWIWYKNSCGSLALASGPVLRILPNATTTYFVRGEGMCNVTNCGSVTITVLQKSIAPTGIIAPIYIYKRTKTILRQSGGKLGDNAEWEWHKGFAGSGKFLGKGNFITIRPRRATTYSVRAVGECNTSEWKSVLITPLKLHNFDKLYSEKDNKFFHIGNDLGIENFEFSRVMHFNKKDINGNFILIDSAMNFINGCGLKTNTIIHPIIKNYFSLGLLASAGLGTTTLIFKDNEKTDNKSITYEKYRYAKIDIGSELALGFKKAKILIIFRRTKQFNDYKKTVTENGKFIKEFILDQRNSNEIISLGLRIGNYSGNKKGSRPKSFDILYNLKRNITNDLFLYSLDDYKNFQKWNIGGGINFWIQNKLKFQFDLTLKTKQNEINKIDFNNANYQISIVLSRDRFY